MVAGPLVVGEDGGVLFANSSMPFDTHIQAFASGRRTVPSAFAGEAGVQPE